MADHIYIGILYYTRKLISEIDRLSRTIIGHGEGIVSSLSSRHRFLNAIRPILGPLVVFRDERFRHPARFCDFRWVLWKPFGDVEQVKVGFWRDTIFGYRETCVHVVSSRVVKCHCNELQLRVATETYVPTDPEKNGTGHFCDKKKTNWRFS